MSWKYSDEEQMYNNRFQTIAILSHPDYGDNLKRLINRRVKLILDDTLSIDTILDIIQKNMADVGNNALWILITGIYSVVDMEPFRSCGNCLQPLISVLPQKDFTFETDISLSIDTRLSMIDRALEKAQRVLGTSAILVLAPPLPAVVVKIGDLNHSELHVNVGVGASITKNNKFAEIEGAYNMYCKAMTALSCKILQRWINPRYFDNFGNKSSKSNVNCEHVRKLWYETMEALFESVLNQPYTNEDKQRCIQVPYVYDQVVIVGFTGYTGLLQSMTQGMPVIFLDDTLDLNDKGLKVLHHLKTKWPSRTLWIVMVGISELAWPVDSMSLCSYVNCENQLPAFVTKNHELGSEAFKGISNERMVDIIVHSAFDFAIKASRNIGDGSAVLMAPFIPQMGIYSGISCTETHEMLHTLFDRNRDVPFFVGSIDSWKSCAENLDYKWLSHIKNIFVDNSVPLRLIEKYEVEKNSLLTFINSRSEIDGQTIRHKWSKLMVELIIHFLHCKVNSPPAFKTSQDSQPPTTNTDYQQQSGHLDVALARALPLGYPGDTNIPNVQTMPLPSRGAMSRPSSTQHLDLPGPPSLNTLDYQQQSGHLDVALARALPLGYPGDTNIPNVQTMPLPSRGAMSRPSSTQHLAPPRLPSLNTLEYQPSTERMNAALSPAIPLVPPADRNSSATQNNLVAGALPSSYASIHQPPPGTTPNHSVSTPSPPETALATSSSSKSHPPVSRPSQAASNFPNKACFLVQNSETEINPTQVKMLLKYFGPIEDVMWPSDPKGVRGKLIMVAYKDSTHAECAARILSFLKVFGENSKIKLYGREDEKLELLQDDLKILMNVNESIEKFKKDMKEQKEMKNNPEVALEQNPYRKNFKGNSTDEAGDFEVAVIYKGDLVPVESINQLFKGLGAVNNGDFRGEEIVYHFNTYCPELKILDNIRFPDKVMRVQVSRPDKVTIFPKNRMNAAEEKIRHLLSTIMHPVEEALKEELEREVNIYTFKTEPCKLGLRCEEMEICPRYHTKIDRRRSPLAYKYSDTCVQMKSRGVCDNRDYCSKIHSPMEELLHLSLYKASLCRNEDHRGSGKDVRRLCYNAHKGEPDMFYHDRWIHLFVKGLEKTLSYLRGAIMNLFKYPSLECPRVLLITPSEGMANMYLNCISDFVASCGRRAMKLEPNMDFDGRLDVIIATSSTIVPLLPLPKDGKLTKKINLSRLRALIIDDGPTVFNSLTTNKKIAFQSFAMHLRGLNVVVTAEKLSDSDLRVAEETLSLSEAWITHDSTNQRGLMKASKASSSRSPERSETQNFPSTNVSSSSKYSMSPKRSRSPSSSLSRVAAQSSEITGINWDNILQNTDGESSDKYVRRDWSPRGKRQPTNSSVDRSKFEMPKEGGSSKQSDPKERKAELYQALEALKEQHDRDLELYTKKPERHPLYEEFYSNYLAKYKENYPESNDFHHFEKLWKKFWTVTLKELLTNEYRAKFGNQYESITTEISYIESQKER
ncbi:uncharacterized protein [Palaemon carinicauda]|uniref:uncharacterized protein isoform X2 n=1 Tax=Palaemon carinicauda TaxID=392227 RepID=UPI0035B5845C